MAFVEKGRYRFCGGGLLAHEDDKEELLGQLIQQADADRLSLVFFNVTGEDLRLLRKFGFQATKWGEEALVDLAECDWSGRTYEWVRRQSNYCRRSGLSVAECDRAAMLPEEWEGLADELEEVSAQFLATKPQASEIRILEGAFDPRRLGRQRLFLCRGRDGAGRIEGFLVCNPCLGGRTWAAETYRHRPDAVRGTVAFLIHEAMQAFKAEGVEAVSLCLIPGLHCREPLSGDSPLVRRGVVWGTERFRFVFDTSGAYHFKTRFRPRFEDRYLCARPGFTLGAAWTFIRLLGVLKLHPGKLCRLVAERWRKRSARATLWTPDGESPRLPR